MISLLLHLSVNSLALLVVSTFADFPYNPARIFITNNGSAAYIFPSRVSTSPLELQLLNTSDLIDVAKPLLSPVANPPFLGSSSSKAVTLIPHSNDLNVLAGDCRDESAPPELWHYTPDGGKMTGSWGKLSLSSTDSTFNTNFLSAGFSFSPTASQEDASFYIFGGMCPNGTSTIDNWMWDAVYCNDMLQISPDPVAPAAYPLSTYKTSILPSRGPPVAEAGLTLTPLTPTYLNTSSASVAQQQDFVLIGGHTQQAFINMSQVAIFSLPQESWSFRAIRQPGAGKTDLMARSSVSEVEPRSGHTAVLTPDGSKIIVFGGWVGDVLTPAEPQLAILELGQGYGGVGDWMWTVPSTPTYPFKPGQGIYGHGAAMLEGGVMLVFGGYSISATSSKTRRRNAPAANTQMLLFNVTSSSFTSTYTNPLASRSDSSIDPKSGSGALGTTSQKAGLGAGLVLGISAVAGVVMVYILYSRRLRQKRAMREKDLRELALGAEHFSSSGLVAGGVDGRGGNYSASRTASWASRQEKRISAPGDEFPWAPLATAGQSRHGENGIYGNGEREAERTGLLVEIPSPTRGLRRSLHSKGPVIYNPGTVVAGNSTNGPPNVTSEIHTIAEQDEDSEAGGSLRRPKSLKTRRGDVRAQPGAGDPFKDPPPPLVRSRSDLDRLDREREVQGWVEDWEVAGAAMESGRAHPHASSKPEQSRGGHHDARSGSPDKSDRTNSNLSERSTMSSSSIQRSVFGTLSRNASMRSASAGCVLLANAAAAMPGRATLINHPGPGDSEGKGGVARASSKRSASLNLNSNASTRYRVASQKERSDTFSTARTSLGPSQPGEMDALLSHGASTHQDDGYEAVFETPPAGPVKERAITVSGSGRKAIGWIGSMRRALTGTEGGRGGIARHGPGYEQRDAKSSSNQDPPPMAEVSDFSSPRRAASASAAFWRGKKGAKDWDAEPLSPTNGGPSSGSGTVVRRKPVPGQAEAAPGDDHDADEWDVEAAVQKRLVQVMFTVPKEKLRVVNADQLSLVSKSDVDAGEREGEGEGRMKDGKDELNKRVSVVVEEENESPVGDQDRKGKGKGKEKEKEMDMG